MSVWSIRKFGWLELGFDTSYFLRTLLRMGWTPQRHTLPGINGADVIVARRSGEFYRPADLTFPPDEGRGWHGPEGEFRFTAGEAVMSCGRDPDVGEVEFTLGNFAPIDLPVTLRAGAGSGWWSYPAAPAGRPSRCRRRTGTGG